MIKELEYDVINKIAAGEVVQRPSSVVKELIENSLDSGADSIEVTIIDAGKSLIQVNDNGSGMNLSDIKLCYKNILHQKFFTLKIYSSSLLKALEVKRCQVLGQFQK